MSPSAQLLYGEVALGIISVLDFRFGEKNMLEGWDVWRRTTVRLCFAYAED